jgi:ribosomal protein L11
MKKVDPNFQHKIQFFISAQSASSGPPLGTVLGNLGVNAVKLAEAFNNYTEKLPGYFCLKVTIYIYENRTFDFAVEAPSTGAWLKRLRFQKEIASFKGNFPIKKVRDCINLHDLIKLSLFRFPTLPLVKSFPMV